jgi:hypothetical protein
MKVWPLGAKLFLRGLYIDIWSSNLYFIHSLRVKAIAGKTLVRLVRDVAIRILLNFHDIKKNALSLRQSG